MYQLEKVDTVKVVTLVSKPWVEKISARIYSTVSAVSGVLMEVITSCSKGLQMSVGIRMGAMLTTLTPGKDMMSRSGFAPTMMTWVMPRSLTNPLTHPTAFRRAAAMSVWFDPG
jgi:hypothetical protein